MFPTEPVPERIGPYRVIRRLAGPGSADVYLGRMEGPMGFSRVCDLKLVPNSIEGDVRLAEELAREASICARLNHPAIVRMYDFFEHDRHLVLVLEHVDGAELERLLAYLVRRRQRLSDDAIFYLGHELVGALAHAHANVDEDGNVAPVIHRNLQPENIIVSWEGQVRLAGFGLGKVLGRTPDTVAGMIKGTPGYMAPEQARGERVTPRADVYGFGLVMWSLLSGLRPPIDGTRPESLGKLRSDVPREITAAIDAALEPSPDRRKITCQELEQWVGKVAKLEAGRSDLREKMRMLRGTRTPAGPVATESIRAARGAQPRRRHSVKGIRASQRPPGPGPLSVPPPPSNRPALRASQRPSARAGATGAPGSSTAPLSSRAPDGSVSPMSPSHGPGGSVAPLSARVPPPPRLPRESLPDHDASSVAPQAAGNGSRSVPAEADASAAGEWRDVGAGAAATGSLDAPLVTPFEPTVTGGGPTVTRPRASRPLTALESVGVAAVTAALVVGMGVFLAERSSPEPAVAPPPAASAHPEPPATVVQAQPTGSGAVVPTNEPTAPAPTQLPSGADLPGGFGYIIVKSRVVARVFVNGTNVGPTNEPSKAICGLRHVRLGTIDPMARYPSWVDPGHSVLIACQSVTTVEIEPSPSPGR